MLSSSLVTFSKSFSWILRVGLKYFRKHAGVGDGGRRETPDTPGLPWAWRRRRGSLPRPVPTTAPLGSQQPLQTDPGSQASGGCWLPPLSLGTQFGWVFPKSKLPLTDSGLRHPWLSPGKKGLKSLHSLFCSPNKRHPWICLLLLRVWLTQSQRSSAGLGPDSFRNLGLNHSLTCRTLESLPLGVSAISRGSVKVYDEKSLVIYSQMDWIN